MILWKQLQKHVADARKASNQKNLHQEKVGVDHATTKGLKNGVKLMKKETGKFRSKIINAKN
jgi:hypothetical protein